MGDCGIGLGCGVSDYSIECDAVGVGVWGVILWYLV